jgi:hypothetical protein
VIDTVFAWLGAASQQPAADAIAQYGYPVRPIGV